MSSETIPRAETKAETKLEAKSEAKLESKSLKTISRLSRLSKLSRWSVGAKEKVDKRKDIPISKLVRLQPSVSTAPF